MIPFHPRMGVAEGGRPVSATPSFTDAVAGSARIALRPEPHVVPSDIPSGRTGFHHALFMGMKEGCAHCQVIMEAGRPVDLRYLAVNPAFETLTGLREVEGRLISECVPGIKEAGQDLFETYGRVASGGGPEQFDYFLEPLGRWFSIHAFSPAPMEFIAVFRNSTAERQALEASRAHAMELERCAKAMATVKEATLAASGAFYRDLLNSQGEGFGMVDAEERFLFVNPAGEAIFGVPPGGLVGRSLLEFLAPEARERVRTESARRGQGETGNYELNIIRADGQIRTLLVTATPRSREGDPASQVIGVFRDITDRKQVEEAELRVKKAESLVLMAGSIAQDFNNLFAAILSSLEVARMQTLGREEVQATLHTAEEALRRAIALSWKMNDFSGRISSRMMPLGLSAFVSRWASEREGRLGGRGLDLDLAPVPPILADPQQIEAVLDVLLANAVEAMDGAGLVEGRVRVRLFLGPGAQGPGSPAKGLWVAEPPGTGATVCLEVANDGPCPEPEILARMFDPFFTTKALGRGLGLPSALGLLKKHQAGIHILADGGRGLAFRLHFRPD